MPNIPNGLLCKNKKCPSKYYCFRYMGTTNPYQQEYAPFKPEEGEDRCEYFEPLYDLEVEK